MKHILASGIVSALLLTATAPSFAQSTSAGQFQANANVASTCTVSNGSWTASYPIKTVEYPSSVDKYNNKITVKCTKGTPTVTLRRNTGLNSTCQQNGLNANEQLLIADNGDKLPYRILKTTGGRSSWDCHLSMFDPKLNFSATDTQEFLFELSVGGGGSDEAKRLFNLARAGTYTDTLTFSVEF